MTDVPYGYCHCGCGGKTKIAPKTDRAKRWWVKGEPLRYIQYHGPTPPNKGSDNPAWKGAGASRRSGRQRAVRRYRMGPCEACGASGLDRHHKDGDTHNNEPANIAILCRHCHMAEDGRLDALRERNARVRAAG